MSFWLKNPEQKEKKDEQREEYYKHSTGTPVPWDQEDVFCEDSFATQFLEDSKAVLRPDFKSEHGMNPDECGLIQFKFTNTRQGDATGIAQEMPTTIRHITEKKIVKTKKLLASEFHLYQDQAKDICNEFTRQQKKMMGAEWANKYIPRIDLNIPVYSEANIKEAVLDVLKKKRITEGGGVNGPMPVSDL